MDWFPNEEMAIEFKCGQEKADLDLAYSDKGKVEDAKLCYKSER